MNYPYAPNNMYIHSNKTIKNFGYDFETSVDYKFNSLGYRSNIEFKLNKNPVILLGNTLSFGLGLPLKDTFAYKLSMNIQKPVYNLSYGCYSHTNHDLLNLLKSLLLVDNPSFIIFQMNNLNRFRKKNLEVNYDNTKDLIISEYQKFYREITKLLKNKKHTFLYWDNEDHDVKLPDCLIKNRYFVDTSLKNKKHKIFGKKSNHLIFLKIIQYIKKNKIL